METTELHITIHNNSYVKMKVGPIDQIIETHTAIEAHKLFNKKITSLSEKFKIDYKEAEIEFASYFLTQFNQDSSFLDKMARMDLIIDWGKSSTENINSYHVELTLKQLKKLLKTKINYKKTTFELGDKVKNGLDYTGREDTYFISGKLKDGYYYVSKYEAPLSFIKVHEKNLELKNKKSTVCSILNTINLQYVISNKAPYFEIQQFNKEHFNKILEAYKDYLSRETILSNKYKENEHWNTYEPTNQEAYELLSYKLYDIIPSLNDFKTAGFIESYQKFENSDHQVIKISIAANKMTNFITSVLQQSLFPLNKNEYSFGGLQIGDVVMHKEELYMVRKLDEPRDERKLIATTVDSFLKEEEIVFFDCEVIKKNQIQLEDDSFYCKHVG